MRTKFSNAAFRDGLGQTGGPMGGGDRGAFQTVSLSSGNPYFFSDFVTRWRLYVGLYQTSWEARKIIRIVPEDALRKEWVAENIPEEQAKRISLRLKQLKFINVLKRSLMLERLLGGCLTFMGLDSKEDEPEIPYKASEGSKLRFLNPIPLSRISRMTWENNPLSEYYMRPHKFLINSQEVHASRLLVWDGEPLFDPYDYSLNNFRSNLAGFGPSKLAPIWDDIVKAVGTRQAAYQLIQTNNAIIMAVTNLQDLAGTKSGKLALEKVKDIANQLSLYRAAVIDGEGVQVKTKPASFGSVPELLMTFIQILSAASDIPATRFIGQAPGGLNATGQSDLENYYNVIDSYRAQRIEPELRRIYDVVGYGEFGKEWDKSKENLGFKFPPLWNASELEEAQTQSLIIDNSLKLFEQGLISEEKVIEEINNKEVLSVELDETDIQITDDSGLGFEEGVDPREEIQKLLDRKPGESEPVSRLSPTKSNTTKPTPPSIPNVAVPKQEGIQQPKVAKTTVPLQNVDFKEGEHPRGAGEKGGQFVKKGEGGGSGGDSTVGKEEGEKKIGGSEKDQKDIQQMRDHWVKEGSDEPRELLNQMIPDFEERQLVDNYMVSWISTSSGQRSNNWKMVLDQIYGTSILFDGVYLNQSDKLHEKAEKNMKLDMGLNQSLSLEQTKEMIKKMEAYAQVLYIKKFGNKKVEVYRGVSNDFFKNSGVSIPQKGTSSEILTDSLSSWSYEESVARDHMESYDSGGVLLKTTVEVEEVSFFAENFGALHEREIAIKQSQKNVFIEDNIKASHF